jgi:hypothetical protein
MIRHRRRGPQSPRRQRALGAACVSRRGGTTPAVFPWDTLAMTEPLSPAPPRTEGVRALIDGHMLGTNETGVPRPSP